MGLGGGTEDSGYNPEAWLEKLDQDLAEPKPPLYDVTNEQFEQIKLILQKNKKKGDILYLDEKKGRIDYLTPIGDNLTVRAGKLSKILFNHGLNTEITQILNQK